MHRGDITQTIKDSSLQAPYGKIGLFTGLGKLNLFLNEEIDKFSLWTDQDDVQREAFLERYKCAEPVHESLNDTFGPECARGILHNAHFRNCLEARGHTLVIEGRPGVGKTATMHYLQRILEDAWFRKERDGDATRSKKMRLKDETLATKESMIHTGEDAIDKKIAIASVYFTLDEPSQIKAASVFVKVLADITCRFPEANIEVDRLMKRRPGREPYTEDVITTIVAILNRIACDKEEKTRASDHLEQGTPEKWVCIFLDALDECREDVRDDVLKGMCEIQLKSRIGLVMTSRTKLCHWGVYFRHNLKTIELCALETDIRTYLRRRLNTYVAQWAQDTSCRQRLIDTIIAESNKMCAFFPPRLTSANA